MAGFPDVARRFARVLFGREHLPPAPETPAPPAARGALSLLFAPDDLPEDPPAPPRERSRWLAWLFAPERLEDRDR